MLSDYPALYILPCVLLLGLVIESLLSWREAWSRPAAVVYFTIASWYLYEVYADGIGYFYEKFGADIVEVSLLEICVFLASYRLLIPFFGKLYAKSQSDFINTSRDLRFEKHLFVWTIRLWLILDLIGLYLVDGDVFSVVFPPFSSNPTYLWTRNAVGGGLDFAVSLCGYLHIATVGMMGIQISTLRSPRLKFAASVIFTLALPPYLFQWARNVMLAVTLPGLLAYLLVSGDSLLKRIAFTLVTALAISFWFGIVINNRSGGTQAIYKAGTSLDNQPDDSTNRKSEMNMFEELCYLKTFLRDGTMRVDGGMTYLAEFGAFIPRAIWPDKPLLGIDYAIARGLGGANTGHGVFATISHGMIGQGVLNFGPYLGTVFVAALMALWTALLGHLWNQRQLPQRLALFLIGLGLTFNLGRDITTLVLYPFILGYIAATLYERAHPAIRGAMKSAGQFRRQSFHTA